VERQRRRAAVSPAGEVGLNNCRRPSHSLTLDLDASNIIRGRFLIPAGRCPWSRETSLAPVTRHLGPERGVKTAFIRTLSESGHSSWSSQFSSAPSKLRRRLFFHLESLQDCSSSPAARYEIADTQNHHKNQPALSQTAALCHSRSGHSLPLNLDTTPGLLLVSPPHMQLFCEGGRLALGAARFAD
jgi:hypothetical protein